LVIQQCAEEFQDLSIPVFLSWRSRRYIDSGEGMIFLHTTYTGPKFAWDARERLWEGATVTFVALQLAFHMGFDQVILIGVDHSFSSKGKPNTTVVSKGNDPNHFDPNYFGKGFRWQLPDLETSERAYRMARSAYEEDGRQVLDATIGGKLTVFPKVAYQSLFDEHIIG
jgi:predicted acylesterase/phospholipase RssA